MVCHVNQSDSVPNSGEESVSRWLLHVGGVMATEGRARHGGREWAWPESKKDLVRAGRAMRLAGDRNWK